jgi:hypothetical protein
MAGSSQTSQQQQERAIPQVSARLNQPRNPINPHSPPSPRTCQYGPGRLGVRGTRWGQTCLLGTRQTPSGPTRGEEHPPKARRVQTAAAPSTRAGPNGAASLRSCQPATVIRCYTAVLSRVMAQRRRSTSKRAVQPASSADELKSSPVRRLSPRWWKSAAIKQMPAKRFHWSDLGLVGLGGLEPPPSSLSGIIQLIF